MHISIESPDQPDVIALIADLDAYQDSLYPAESRYALDIASLKLPNVFFAVARDTDGRAIGCGAVVLYDGYGELKRMYVRENCRGKSVARKLLNLLERAAGDAGCTVFKVETGPYQPEALAFYARNGYAPCGRYGDYKDDPLSVFMQKGDTPIDALLQEMLFCEFMLVCESHDCRAFFEFDEVAHDPMEAWSRRAAAAAGQAGWGIGRTGLVKCPACLSGAD